MFDCATRIDTASRLEPNVENDDVRARPLERVDRAGAGVLGIADDRHVARTLHQLFQAEAHDGMIVDDEDAHGGHHREPPVGSATRAVRPCGSWRTNESAPPISWHVRRRDRKPYPLARPIASSMARGSPLPSSVVSRITWSGISNTRTWAFDARACFCTL